MPQGRGGDPRSAAFEGDRYSRQILFPGIGVSGQKCLSYAHAAIVGCGAIGANTAALLARAGVGTLTVIDRDFVEPSNLQRQILFDEADALGALPKAEAARRQISLFNSSIAVHPRVTDLTPANIEDLLHARHGIDLLLDCTDNFETRYLLNDFAVARGVPWIYAAAVGSYAATMNILPRLETNANHPPAQPPFSPTGCLACLFPAPPVGLGDTCDTVGILSSAVSVASSLQVTEALKFLTRQPHLMRRSLLAIDLWSGERSEIDCSRPNQGCKCCGERLFTHLAGAAQPHITLCGRNSVQIHEQRRPIDLAVLRARIAADGNNKEVRGNDLLVRFRRGEHTLTVFADGRAIVQGTTDSSVARSLYARFIGS